ncbi:DUF397 domain-containing protein [Streptomyces sp. AV19]|uniref:DUF397 domain-containing protein n=1 Tax=Streptomyces sp. AV19 TaxID=2793068 RepID=UPI0018FEA722|nr:DUF397 domain-containing protein [Streptomyces sp. AV19]MBH1935588.1 DUF397 domain-containing protein [Streptomyces sp. AV19]MDG4534475.1 DUF397 domain-containing protein [Streptomyces sp. AV19]
MGTEIQWQKSSFSGGGDEDCIEVAEQGDEILIRESDEPERPAILRRRALAAALLRVKSGDFDSSAT